MTVTDDIPTFVIDADDDAIEEPIPFRLQYVNAAGEKDTADFAALGDIPYGWVLDFWHAGGGGMAEQGGAMLEFFTRVIVPEDRDRFLALIHDPVLRVHKRTLQAIAVFLLQRYEGLVDPTRARSAGRGTSRSGSRATGSGRSGRQRAKAST